MTLPPSTVTADNPDFTPLVDAITELIALEKRKQELMAIRDTEMRRLRQRGVSVTELRDRSGLSKSMVRLVTTEPRTLKG